MASQSDTTHDEDAIHEENTVSHEEATLVASAAAYSITTLLASCWGLLSAYLLFDALLVRHAFISVLAALMPMIIVWATLERKRWGRLALLGLSTIVFLFFAIILLAIVFTLMQPRNTLLSLQPWLQLALRPYGGLVPAALTLLLATLSGPWLRRPDVTAEFERNKRAALALPQRMIASFLVISWAVLVAFSALVPNGKSIDASQAKLNSEMLVGPSRSGDSKPYGQ